MNSTLAIIALEMRIVRTGSKPVAGRPAPGRLPPLVFCTIGPTNPAAH